MTTMASKKRGLSLEEKRQRMMEIFYTKKEFFLLKELEKIGPKEKGITSQSVKDVVQSLGEIYVLSLLQCTFLQFACSPR